MASTITHVAIHDLQKKSDSEFEFVPGKPNVKTGKTVQRVVDDLHGLYARRTTKSHGKFAIDTDNYPTQKFLKTYLDGGAKDFDTLTASLMRTLATQAQRKPGATGGHVFFVHFQDGSKHFLMIAIVNDRLNAAITDEFDVEDVVTLDLDGFRFAGRINLSSWVANEDRYVSFLKGKGDVADYFKEFLGCDNVLQDKLDTQNLVKALKDFAEQQKMIPVDRDAFLSKAKFICDQSASKNSELQFNALANELFPSEPELLLSLLTDDDRQLNDRFVPNRRALGSLVRFKAKTSFWSVEFERDAITQNKVKYDPKSNSITLSDIPSELAAELKVQFDV